MPIAIWNDNYKTGHAVVDRQHQELFQMVNQLHDSIVAGKGKDVLQPTLEKLARYTIQHFGTEEALMMQTHYPLLAVHRQKHQALAQKAKEIIEGYKSGKNVLTITLSQFLADWLSHHINEDDKALIDYLHRR
ncbi:MAG: hemerythrin family protein [Acidobacteria bacterium]|nr:hemerythrin family protein [Acidobacteriota bacterium]